MDDPRLEFLFGRVPERPSEYADEDGRIALLTADRPDDDIAMRMVIANQVLGGEPAAAWRAAERMLGQGLARHAAMDQLVAAVEPHVLRVLHGTGSFDVAGYVAELDRLPGPDPAAVLEAFEAEARAAVTSSSDALGERTADRLGLPHAEPGIEAALARAEEALLRSGRLAMLAPDVIVHLPALAAGSVLTHRLTEEEYDDEVLLLFPDLAPFAALRADELTVFDPDGLGGWSGPVGWLAGYEVGTLLAVGVGADGAVTVAALDTDPVAPDDLVAAVRTAYDMFLGESGLPVSGTALAAGVLAADRTAFAQPRPPLIELAAAAGLEHRDDRFAHDESVWERAADRGRRWRFQTLLDGRAQVAEQAWEQLAAPDASGLRRALELLGDPEVMEVVVDEFLEADDVAALVALADRLLVAAGNAPRAAVAGWIAAVAAERDDRVLDAEAHLRAASRAGRGWPIVEDRLAWFESDRGDAAAALARWESIDTPHDDPDLAAVRPFAAAASRPDLGRNQPCWCGSGRKVKQCHQGRPAQASLAERAVWLVAKARAYAVRSGIEDDFDPIVLDVALFDDDLLRQFLVERGPLLPADELELGHTWVASPRSVFEVLGPGRVRDLADGEESDARGAERFRVGERVCARAVPDVDGGLLLVEPLWPVEADRLDELLELLEEDPQGVILWNEPRYLSSSRRLLPSR